jgi:Arc/MetJ-type ribon-helix-helix transcriptional regulator
VEAWERRKAEENFIMILKYLYSTIIHSDIMSDQISSRLPPKFVSEIESLVNGGYYLSTSDFVREAVREKLEVIKEIRLREVSLNVAKKEIYRYLLQNPDSYPYDIANELRLELSLVHEALIELRKEGKAEEVE